MHMQPLKMTPKIPKLQASQSRSTFPAHCLLQQYAVSRLSRDYSTIQLAVMNAGFGYCAAASCSFVEEAVANGASVRLSESVSDVHTDQTGSGASRVAGRAYQFFCSNPHKHSSVSGGDMLDIATSIYYNAPV